MSGPKYFKTTAAEQLGVSLYRVNKMIAVGQLPIKPTEESVAKLKARNDRELEKYRKAIIEAYESGRSLFYCMEMVKVATDNMKLWLPVNVTVWDFVERTVYDHLMEEKRNGIK